MLFMQFLTMLTSFISSGITGISDSIGGINDSIGGITSGITNGISQKIDGVIAGFDGLIMLPKLIRTGNCPDVPVVQNFELDRYLGRWYELKRFENPFQSGACATADYSLFPNGSISVVNSQITNGVLNSINGIATAPDETVGELIVSFPGALNLGTTTPNYKIVKTDYDVVSVVYSCGSFLGQRLEFAWILGRQPYIPKADLDALEAELEGYGIETSRFRAMRQLNCKRAAVPVRRRRDLFN